MAEDRVRELEARIINIQTEVQRQKKKRKRKEWSKTNKKV